VVAQWLVEALGAENVLGFDARAFSWKASKSDAAAVAKNLGI